MLEVLGPEPTSAVAIEEAELPSASEPKALLPAFEPVAESWRGQRSSSAARPGAVVAASKVDSGACSVAA